MKLDETQRRHLRGLGHRLKPCLQVGTPGVTPAVLTELRAALSHHELLKVKVRAEDRVARDTLITTLADASQAQLVSRVGNVALLYRANPDNPRIQLPATRAPTR